MHKCLGCMEEYKEEYSICPFCGYEQNTPPLEPYHMIPGTVLHNRYTIGKVMGFGGFGVTYIGYDNLLDRKVAIKEYLPGEFSTRIPGTTEIVTYEGERTQQFQKGLEKFVDEAKILAKMQANNGIVQIYDSFLENSTAYIVMEYMEGMELAQYMKNKGQLSVEEAKEILHPILLALKDVHELGIIHRDIAPNNIFLLNDGRVKLYDFGASRYISSSHSKSLSVIVKPGYAPAEQYSSRGSQGPWTDVYSLAATFYSMITGIVPEDAMDRIEKEELKKPSKLGVKIKKSTENALMNALNIKAENRTQNVEILEKELFRDDKVKLHFVRLKKADVGKWPLWAKLSVSAGILAVLVFAGLLATGVVDYTYILPESFVVPEGKSRVPNLVNSDVTKAESKMVEAGLVLQIVDKQHSEYIPEGKVLSQNVRKGKIINELEVVEVVVSAGRELIYMIDVVGLQREEALDKLFDLGLNVEIAEEYSSYAEGVVMAQSVAGGEEVYRGDKILVTVSKGVDTYVDTTKELELPDMVGMTMEEALVVAQRYGFYLNTARNITARGKGGTIAAQTPNAGSTVCQGDTINLIMYVEPVVIRMPDVQYKDGTQSVDTLKNLGLVVNTVYEESETVAQGKVISQSIAPNTEIETGDSVTLVISKGGKIVYNWSEWVTELPAGVDANNYEIDIKQQYRFRDKATMPSPDPVVDGWTQYDMQVSKGEYGEYSLWSDVAPTPNENRDIQTEPRYLYEHRENAPNTQKNDDTMNGWLEDPDLREPGYGEWKGNWSNWSTTSQSTSDVVQERVATWYTYTTKEWQMIQVEANGAVPAAPQGFTYEGKLYDKHLAENRKVDLGWSLTSIDELDSVRGLTKTEGTREKQKEVTDYDSWVYKYTHWIIEDQALPGGYCYSWYQSGCEATYTAWWNENHGIYRTAVAQWDSEETTVPKQYWKYEYGHDVYVGGWYLEEQYHPLKTETYYEYHNFFTPYLYTYRYYKVNQFPATDPAKIPSDAENKVAVKVYSYQTRDKYTIYHFYRWVADASYGAAQTESSTCRLKDTKTYYRYRDKQDVYTYYYYKWGSWSDWRDEKVDASSTREVEPRTLYRYKQKS